MAVGNTIRNIVAEPRIATARLQTGLVALREATPLPTVKRVLDNSLVVRAALCRVTALEVVVGSATGPAAESVRAIEQVVEEQIASAVGISRAEVAETEMPSEEVPGAPGATTDRAHAPAAVAAPPAWDREAEAEALVAAVVVAAGGADKKPTGELTWSQHLRRDILQSILGSAAWPFCLRFLSPRRNLPWKIRRPLPLPLR